MNNVNNVAGEQEAAVESVSADSFKLERYKYILKQIHFLNENINKYRRLFQSLTTAIVGAGAAVFMSWRKLDIDVSMARLTIQALLGLMLILGAKGLSVMTDGRCAPAPDFAPGYVGQGTRPSNCAVNLCRVGVCE